MNIQIHRKQLIVLVLSMMLAIGSQWIPVPPESQVPNPGLSDLTAHTIPLGSAIRTVTQ